MVLGFKQQFKPLILSGQKIHTLRVDEKHRWKKGMEIHFATGVRTKNYDCFGKSPCLSIQEVWLSDHNGCIQVCVGNNFLLNEKQLQEFVKNDGFDSYESFHDWFYPLIEAEEEKRVSLRLIHWTYKRY